jgi:hypothetical protein
MIRLGIVDFDASHIVVRGNEDIHEGREEIPVPFPTSEGRCDNNRQ